MIMERGGALDKLSWVRNDPRDNSSVKTLPKSHKKFLFLVYHFVAFYDVSNAYNNFWIPKQGTSYILFYCISSLFLVLVTSNIFSKISLTEIIHCGGTTFYDIILNDNKMLQN